MREFTVNCSVGYLYWACMYWDTRRYLEYIALSYSCFKVADGCAGVAMPLMRLMGGHIRRPLAVVVFLLSLRSAGSRVN